MQYVYAALLLHSAKREINEANVKKIIEASGAAADSAQIKALIASLDGVNIDEAMSKAAVAVAAPAASTGGEAKAEKKEEKKEDKKTEEEAAGGLAALFG